MSVMSSVKDTGLSAANSVHFTTMCPCSDFQFLAPSNQGEARNLSQVSLTREIWGLRWEYIYPSIKVFMPFRCLSKGSVSCDHPGRAWHPFNKVWRNESIHEATRDKVPSGSCSKVCNPWSDECVKNGRNYQIFYFFMKGYSDVCRIKSPSFPVCLPWILQMPMLATAWNQTED